MIRESSRNETSSWLLHAPAALRRDVFLFCLHKKQHCDIQQWKQPGEAKIGTFIPENVKFRNEVRNVFNDNTLRFPRPDLTRISHTYWFVARPTSVFPRHRKKQISFIFLPSFCPLMKYSTFLDNSLKINYWRIGKLQNRASVSWAMSKHSCKLTSINFTRVTDRLSEQVCINNHPE